jgi:hypothetical protein
MLDFLGIETHSSCRRDALHDPRSQAGARRGRSQSISRRISPNNWLGTATSAIWKVMSRAWVTIFCADFDELFAQPGQRPVLDSLRQCQRPHEVGKIVV